jgi:hypothetical protein
VHAGAPPSADSWGEYLATLKGAVHEAAQSIREPDEQTIFQGLLDPERLTFAKLSTKEARLEFGAFDNWTRAKVRVISLDDAQFGLYMSFRGPIRAAWRDLTPDERRDLTTDRDDIPTLIANAAALDKWRQERNLEVLKHRPELAVKLALPGGDTPERIVEAMSVGAAAERLRRILVDTSFAQESTKFEFILAVWNDVKTGKEPFKAMKDSQSVFALRGKESRDAVKAIPVMKAVATSAIACHGVLENDLLMAVMRTADPNLPGIPRLPDGSVDKVATLAKKNDREWRAQVLAPLYVAYAKSRGVRTNDAEYSIRGGATPAAYWLASPQGASLIDKKLTTAEVMGKLAIDEIPEYQLGFIVVELDEATKAEWTAKIGHVTRPTAIDALGFDQFAVNPDPDACLGITSGGIPEVVVREVPLSRTAIVRQP